ncbi:transposase [Streptomyces sp. NPDC007896]|uniref:transposase n=1 Tax=Streptomyces sp. NPDC007896 TaxID=3364784 RepID=UPI0036E58825
MGVRILILGILFVLHTGVAWEHEPQELGCGSGMTWWRRPAEWTEADVWPRCTRFCSPNCVVLTPWTSPGLPSTAPTPGRQRGLQDRTKPC